MSSKLYRPVMKDFPLEQMIRLHTLLGTLCSQRQSMTWVEWQSLDQAMTMLCQLLSTRAILSIVATTGGLAQTPYWHR